MSPGPNQHSERKFPTHGGAQAHGPVVSGILVHPTGFCHGCGSGRVESRGTELPFLQRWSSPKGGDRKEREGSGDRGRAIGIGREKIWKTAWKWWPGQRREFCIKGQFKWRLSPRSGKRGKCRNSYLQTSHVLADPLHLHQARIREWIDVRPMSEPSCGRSHLILKHKTIPKRWLLLVPHVR